uniref:Acid phosphatase n=1 Tax=Caenorhabditis japonica TaxID=281687 RepID=A0A8R1HN63_CAEJA
MNIWIFLLVVTQNVLNGLLASSDRNDYELIFVQALWRHGSRGPTHPYKKNTIPEEDWKRIGSGYGQLTNDGGNEQLELGKAIRERYVNSGFLPKQFDEHLAKFRTSNRNRTIYSAEFNFMGMYPKPKDLEKFKKELSIKEEYSSDCVNNVMCSCERRSVLQRLGRNTTEYKNLVQEPWVIQLFHNLSEITGENVDARNFWRIPDTLRCEKRYFPKRFPVDQFPDDLMVKLEDLNTKINRFTSGLYTEKVSFGKPNTPNYKSIDIGKEIAKIRSGPLISHIYKRLKTKLNCLKSKRAARSTCSPLKYHAYSSHDMTLYALLTAMGLQDVTASDVCGWPSYASSLFIELSIFYRNPSVKKFENITPKMPFCHGKSHCQFEVFERIYNDFLIDIPIHELAQMYTKIRQLCIIFFYIPTTLFLGFLNAETEVSDDLQLVFVHTVWRHGDRSQDGHLKNDPVDASEWIKGGGGYGQLSPEGMAQHFHLGKKLRDRYMNKFKFLHPFYDSQQIYVRSTDSNRTINSALSNMLGMFTSNDSRPGIDYPDIEGWPRGFMPLPIHTATSYLEDCMANAFCNCRRRESLLEIAHKGEQFQNFLNSEKYINVTTHISEVFNTTFTWENLWKVHDAVSTQLVHFPEILENQSWYSPQFSEDVKEMNRLTNTFISGLYDPAVVQGINVRREILKTRGGPLVNEIATRMRTKARCAKNPTKCDNYHQNLKYYAYSTHDHTVFALLAVLGIEGIVGGKEKYGQWPDYAADILIELFHNSTSGQPCFRMLYADNDNSEFDVVTPNIKGCNSKEFCDLKVFDHLAKEYRPDRPINEFCEIPPVPENQVPAHYEQQAAQSTQSAITNYWYLPTILVSLFSFHF